MTREPTDQLQPQEDEVDERPNEIDIADDIAASVDAEPLDEASLAELRSHAQSIGLDDETIKAIYG